LLGGAGGLYGGHCGGVSPPGTIVFVDLP